MTRQQAIEDDQMKIYLVLRVIATDQDNERISFPIKAFRDKADAEKLAGSHLDYENQKAISEATETLGVWVGHRIIEMEIE